MLLSVIIKIKWLTLMHGLIVRDASRELRAVVQQQSLV